MTYDIKGAPDMATHNGTAGWGISNRTMDLVSLEVAWFMYNGSHGPVGAASQLTRPIFNLFGSELPRGFFLMVKRAGLLHPQVKLLDPALLSGDHAYAVKLGDESVDFFVDGTNVGAFRDPPAGRGVDLGQQPLPLMGQMWLDSSYWFPFPIPEFNEREQRLTITRYRQGPSASTPIR